MTSSCKDWGFLLQEMDSSLLPMPAMFKKGKSVIFIIISARGSGPL